MLFLEGFPNSFIQRPTLELLFDIMQYESAIAVEVRTQVPQICYSGCYLFEMLIRCLFAAVIRFVSRSRYFRSIRLSTRSRIPMLLSIEWAESRLASVASRHSCTQKKSARHRKRHMHVNCLLRKCRRTVIRNRMVLQVFVSK